MDIKLNKIKYKNILSVGANPVELALDKYHTTFVTGKNGASKSTLIEAIIFALFGRAYRDVTKGQLVNSINKKALLVELWFTVDRNKYYIKRGIKPNIFTISCNDKEITEDASVRDYQKYLENSILKINYKTSKQIVALGTAGFKPFMQLRAYERREVVEDLLDIKVFSKMTEDNKSILNSINDDIKRLESVYTSKAKERSIYTKVYDDAIKDNETRIQGFKEKIEKYTNRLNTNIEKLNKCNEQIQQLSNKLKPFDQSELTHQVSVKMLAGNNIKNIQKGIDFFKDHSKCPTCKQHIDDSYIDKKLNQYQQEVDEAQKDLDKASELIIELERVRDTNKKINDKIDDIKTLINGINHEIETDKKFITQSEKEINKLRTASDDLDVTKIEKLSSQLEKITEKKNEKSFEKHSHAVVSNILKDNGVKARIISQYIPVINKLINHYLQLMDANYVFELDNEFNETIKSRGREDFSYNSFSQGEKMRIDIAILFTWRELIRLKNSSAFNILIMDEILDSAADQEGIDNIMNILKSLKNNIIIISHNDKIDPAQFDKHIQMVKKGNFSHVQK